MSFFDKWILSLLPVGLSIMETLIKQNINKPEFWAKYDKILRAIVKIGESIKPYVPDN